MKIITAMDFFKECMTSVDASNAVKIGLQASTKANVFNAIFEINRHGKPLNNAMLCENFVRNLAGPIAKTISLS
jgi:hypothetical protein